MGKSNSEMVRNYSIAQRAFDVMYDRGYLVNMSYWKERRGYVIKSYIMRGAVIDLYVSDKVKVYTFEDGSKYIISRL